MTTAIIHISKYDDLNLILNNDFVKNSNRVRITLSDIHFDYDIQDEIEEHFRHDYLIRDMRSDYEQLEAIKYYHKLKENFSSKPIQKILEVFDMESSLEESTDFSIFFSFGFEVQGTPIRPDLFTLITEMAKNNEDDYEERKIRVWKEELFDYVSEFHKSFESFEHINFSGLGSINLDNTVHKQIIWDLASRNWIVPGNLTRSMCENGFMQPNGNLVGKAAGVQYKAWSYILKYPFLFTELAKSCSIIDINSGSDPNSHSPQLERLSAAYFVDFVVRGKAYNWVNGQFGTNPDWKHFEELLRVNFDNIRKGYQQVTHKERGNKEVISQIRLSKIEDAISMIKATYPKSRALHIAQDAAINMRESLV